MGSKNEPILGAREEGIAMDLIHTSFVKGDYKKIVKLEKTLLNLGCEEELLVWVMDLKDILEAAYETQHNKKISEMI